MFFLAVGLALATRYADLIIDMDALADRDVRYMTEEYILREAGIAVDLSDYFIDGARIRRVFEHHQMTVSVEMTEIIRAAISWLKPDWNRALRFNLTYHTDLAIRFLRGDLSEAKTPLLARIRPEGDNFWRSVFSRR